MQQFTMQVLLKSTHHTYTRLSFVLTIKLSWYSNLIAFGSKIQENINSEQKLHFKTTVKICKTISIHDSGLLEDILNISGVISVIALLIIRTASQLNYQCLRLIQTKSPKPEMQDNLEIFANVLKYLQGFIENAYSTISFWWNNEKHTTKLHLSNGWNILVSNKCVNHSNHISELKTQSFEGVEYWT